MFSNRLLITGSRDWTDQGLLQAHLLAYADVYTRGGLIPVTLVHGGAVGADRMAADIWRGWGLPVEVHRWQMYGSPRARNQHMVNLGADQCIAAAKAWASGTGMCARMARRADINTLDIGVRTDVRIDASVA